MINTPKSLRLHIGIFGRRNVGKSSILNALVGQYVSIVSDTPGTTTDPVEKVMELKPVGPVVFIDTAGLDDIGALGKARIAQTRKVIDRTELAVLVTDNWTEYETKLVAMLREKQIPFVVAANKRDLRKNDALETAARKAGIELLTSTTATGSTGIDALRNLIIQATPEAFLESVPVIADLVSPGELVVLVTPIDIEAPKGRLKMLQVHCIREILDKNATLFITKETELADVLSRLNAKPDLVVCDSQVFEKVVQIITADTPVTTFSIVMARFKGDFETMLAGTQAIDNLKPGDKVLIAEACTHHPIGEDIGRVQIPNLLKQYAGEELKIDVTAGRDFPENLAQYKLIIHCGACVFNRAEMLTRISSARLAGVPITNYGMTIAKCRGILDRAVEIFQNTNELIDQKS
ncbi:MAG: [FeFe] hydrogenase H-cluster maturation GTPase HydF [Phycisphaerae bacterium]|jgi:[FeFe] hydrogenase H-cluster maturation GTPase HydF